MAEVYKFKYLKNLAKQRQFQSWDLGNMYKGSQYDNSTVVT